MHPLTRRIVRRSPAPTRGAVEVVIRTVDDTIADRVPGLAAEIAFFVLLSLPPLFVTVIALAEPIGSAFDADFARDLTVTVDGLASAVFTEDTVDTIVLPTINQVFGENAQSIGVISFVVSVWAASRAVKVVLTAITSAYDLEATRPGWQQRLMGLALTAVGVVLGLVVLPVMVAGPQLGEILSARLGMEAAVGAGLGTIWRIAYWPGVVLSATGLIATVYHFGAPWQTPWRRDLPGAALAVVVWVAGSAGLRLYTTTTIVGGDSLYGPIAGPLVLLVWLYVSGFAVLLGAELNAEIEKMWPVAPQKGADPEPDRLVDTAQLPLLPPDEVPPERHAPRDPAADRPRGDTVAG